MNVCSEIASHGMCIGCGVCVAACPTRRLDVYCNEYGEFAVGAHDNQCQERCDMCLQVCPFHNNKDNSDSIGEYLYSQTPDVRHTPEAGYYLKCFLGYSRVGGHRENGASGGFATWVLETLLRQGIVDCVACVSPTKASDRLFAFELCRNPEEVRVCSKSCYYPVEISNVLQYIQKHDGRYAIIALPCMCKAIRLAQLKIPKLRRRIKYVLGLVCGQTKNKSFVEYVCALGGGNPNTLSSVRFRVKDPSRPASDYGLSFTCNMDANKGPHQGTVFFTDGMDHAWSDRYFTPAACGLCDDVFAECADAAFMDAWLPRYCLDPKGHSLAVVRSAQLVDIFHVNAGELQIENVGIDDIISSQKGVLRTKRHEIRERMRMWRKHSHVKIPLRPYLYENRIGWLERQIVQLRDNIARRSATTWMVCDKNISAFHRELHLVIVSLSLATFLLRTKRRCKRGIAHILLCIRRAVHIGCKMR